MDGCDCVACGFDAFPNRSRNFERGMSGRNIKGGKRYLILACSHLTRSYLKACPAPRQSPHQTPTTIQLIILLPGFQQTTSRVERRYEIGRANMISSRRMGAGREVTRSCDSMTWVCTPPAGATDAPGAISMQARCYVGIRGCYRDGRWQRMSMTETRWSATRHHRVLEPRINNF